MNWRKVSICHTVNARTCKTSSIWSKEMFKKWWKCSRRLDSNRTWLTSRLTMKTRSSTRTTSATTLRSLKSTFLTSSLWSRTRTRILASRLPFPHFLLRLWIKRNSTRRRWASMYPSWPNVVLNCPAPKPKSVTSRTTRMTRRSTLAPCTRTSLTWWRTTGWTSFTSRRPREKASPQTWGMTIENGKRD